MPKKNSTQAPVSDLKSHIGFWLRYVSNHVSQAFAKALSESGVTVAEWVVLREMYATDDTSPSIMARAIGLTRGAASKLVDRLVEKRLVTRQEHGDDRRFQVIALTSAGRQLVPKLAEIADRNDEAFFSRLSVRERDALVATLKKLVQEHGLNKVPTE